MAKDPAVLFYTADFLSGVSFLSYEHRGQYITLLAEQHQLGHIPEQHMLDVCKTRDSPVFQKFIKDDQGLYYNERMELEKNKRASYSESRKNNRKGSKKDSSSPPHIPKHMSEHVSGHMDNGNEDENIIDFRNKAEDNIKDGQDEGIICASDYEILVNKYHELCPRMTKIVELTSTRKGMLGFLINKYGIDKIASGLQSAGKSKYLNGGNDKMWRADFDWLMQPANFLKLIEGKFSNRSPVPSITTIDLKNIR